MQRKQFLLGLGALVTAMAWPIGAAAQAPNVKLKLAHFAADSHPAHIASLQFKKNVEARTKGAVTVDIFPANQLGAPPEQLEQTKLGVIDMNLPTQGQLDKYDKAFATVMTPYAFADYAEAHRVLDGPFHAWVAPRMEKQGIVMLSTWEYGFRNVTNSKRPVNSPADMQGLKIRTPPELQIVAAMEAVGAKVTQIAFPELPAALNQGVVDGQENPIGVIYHFKLYETQKHLALTRHVYNSMNHVINANSWKKLSPEQQTIVREESANAAQLMRKLVAEQEDKELKAIAATGVAVTKPDTAQFRALMGPAYKRIGEYAGQENMDTFLKMLK